MHTNFHDGRVGAKPRRKGYPPITGDRSAGRTNEREGRTVVDRELVSAKEQREAADREKRELKCRTLGALHG